MGKETSETTRRMVRLAQGNLCGIQLLKGLGGAAPQPDVSQARPMDVSLDQKAMATDRYKAKSSNTIDFEQC